MEARQVWRIADGPAPVEVRLQMEQTLDETALRADVALGGRPFFARVWRLDLSTAPWRFAR
jgi:hypothetical protein